MERMIKILSLIAMVALTGCVMQQPRFRAYCNDYDTCNIEGMPCADYAEPDVLL